MGATYRDAASKIKKYEVHSIKEQPRLTKNWSEVNTVSYFLEKNSDYIVDGDYVVDPKNNSMVAYTNYYTENLVVPSSIAGVNIEEIDYQAFIGHYNLKNVTLTEGLKRINADAFSHCYNLESVTIPSTVESINASAFYGVDTVYFAYHTPEQLNSLNDANNYYKGNEIFGARRAVYGTGENQIIIEDKNLTKL